MRNACDYMTIILLAIKISYIISLDLGKIGMWASVNRLLFLLLDFKLSWTKSKFDQQAVLPWSF